MVHTTTNLNSLLLYHSQTRSSLAGIKDMTVCTCHTLHIFVGHSSNTTHSLHDIQHQTLGLKQRTNLSCYLKCNITLLNRCTILDEYLHLHGWVKLIKHLLCKFNTCNDTVFFYQQMTLTHCILRNATQCCMITIANILGKSQLNKFFL